MSIIHRVDRINYHETKQDSTMEREPVSLNFLSQQIVKKMEGLNDKMNVRQNFNQHIFESQVTSLPNIGAITWQLHLLLH